MYKKYYLLASYFYPKYASTLYMTVLVIYSRCNFQNPLHIKLLSNNPRPDPLVKVYIFRSGQFSMVGAAVFAAPYVKLPEAMAGHGPTSPRSSFPLPVRYKKEPALQDDMGRTSEES